MTYGLVLNEFGPQPYSGWNTDSLFDADRHVGCRRESGIEQFMCARRLYMIEQIDEEPGMPPRVRQP